MPKNLRKRRQVKRSPTGERRTVGLTTRPRGGPVSRPEGGTQKRSSMIIGRSPLRISLGGGGTDLPSYYEEHGGFLVAAAITQYVYVTIQRTPLDHIMLRYSSIERAKTVDEIKH